jgi:hypothetical protein
LAATEMASLCCQHDALIEMTELDTEPAVDTAHVCGDKPGSDFVTGVFSRPSDADRPGQCAGLNEPSPCKAV